MSDSIQRKTVSITKDENIVIIELSRPECLNAINETMLKELRMTLEDCINDEEAGAIVLTGDGKAFCAGQDLRDRDPRKVAFPLDLELIQKELYHPVVNLLSETQKPTITALNGLAAGAGVSLALSTDIVLASDSSQLMFSFVKVGLSSDAGCAWHLVQALGPAKARALLLTGATLSGKECEQLGLIYKCVNSELLKSQSITLAKSLASGPSTAIASIKKCIRSASRGNNLKDYLIEEALYQGLAGSSPDYMAGVLAFLEKRT